MSVYRSIPLGPGFIAIEEASDVRMFLFEGEQEAILIDAGFGKGDLKAFAATLTDKPITKVILTHADMDHTGCCNQFDEVWMHPAEFDRFRAAGMADVNRVRPLWEGDEIRIGNRTLTVVLIPGHTPGSIALLDRENRMLISGDSVQNGTIYMFGPGRNMPALLHSLDKLQAMSDSFDTIYPSHSDVTVSPEILPEIKQAALDVLAGKIPEQPPTRELPCRYYDCGVVRFFYKEA